MAIGLLFNQLYNTVDAIIVGKYVSKQALAAVGCTTNIVNMLVGLFNGLSAGAGIVISQAYGAKNKQRLHDAVHTTISLTFIFGVIATFACVLLVNPLLNLMDAPSDVFSDAHTYLTIYFAGCISLLFYNIGSGILRAVGDSVKPLYFLAITAILNTFLDLLFVVVFELGVAGAAYATIVSEFVSAILVMVVLTKTKADYGIRWKQLKISLPTMKRVFAIGLPSSFQQFITSFSNVFVQSYINFFETDGMAGYASYNKIDAFILIPVQSIAFAISTFVGQNYGASNLKRAREGVKKGINASLITTVFITAVVMIFSDTFLALFNDEAPVIAFGRRFIMIISPFHFLLCFNQIYACALRGIGKSAIPMVVMLTSFVGFRQLFLFINKAYFGQSFLGTALAYPAGWALCSMLLYIMYKRTELGKAK